MRSINICDKNESISYMKLIKSFTTNVSELLCNVQYEKYNYDRILF